MIDIQIVMVSNRLFIFATELKTIKDKTDMIPTISLSTTATMVEKLAAKLQAECLKVRQHLFYDPDNGFNHNMGGVRTGASVKDAEAYINNICGCLIRFKFRSHRMLWFTIQGVSKRYILSAPNQFVDDIEDSVKMNPYLTIESELRKAASELRLMERGYNLLMAA